MICKCSKKNEKPISFLLKKRIVFAGGELWQNTLKQ